VISRPPLRFPFHILFIYCLTGAGWILFSDLLVVNFAPAEYRGVISIAKGWLFITVTAIILALLLHRHHKSQAELERRMREIIDNLPSMLYQFDRDGRAVLFNRAMINLLGPDSESYPGRTRESLGMSAEAAAEHRTNDLSVFEAGHAIVAEEKNLQNDGLHTYLTVKFPLTGSDGSIETVCGVSTDITEHKRAEEERKMLQEQLAQSRKMESMGRLAGGVAHDFNNMLGVILGQAELALMKLAPDQPLYESLQEIRKVPEPELLLWQQLRPDLSRPS